MIVSGGMCFVPRQVTGLVLALDGNDPAGTGIQPSAGTGLASAFDKSGFGNSTSQASAPLRPTFQPNILNGKGCFRFSGSQYMSMGSFGFPMGSQGRTVFIVAKATTLNMIQYFFAHGNATGNGTLTACEITNAITNQRFYFDTRNIYASATTTAPIVTSTNYVFEANYPSGALISDTTLRINGVNQAISTGGATPNTGAGNSFFGCYITAGTGSFSGDIYLLLYFNKSLNASETNFIRAYITHTFGLVC